MNGFNFKKSWVISIATVLLIAVVAVLLEFKANSHSPQYSSPESTNVITSSISIIDSQIHMGAGQVETTLARMDKLGIDTVIVDELELDTIQDPHYQPYELLENGTYRPINPTVQEAAEKYPGRFWYILRVERTDPDAAKIIEHVKASNAGKGIRLIPGMSSQETEAFREGEYEELLSIIEDNELPVFLYLPDNPDLIAKTAQAHPNLTIIVDHCGLYSNSVRKMYGDTYPQKTFEQTMELFGEVLELAQYNNVVLKWSHASENFELPVYPGNMLTPILKDAIEAFGADRIMWASDYSVNTRGESWEDILNGIQKNTDLTDKEIEMILGGTALKYLE